MQLFARTIVFATVKAYTCIGSMPMIDFCNKSAAFLQWVGTSYHKVFLAKYGPNRYKIIAKLLMMCCNCYFLNIMVILDTDTMHHARCR